MRRIITSLPIAFTLLGCSPEATQNAPTDEDWWIVFNSMRSGEGDLYAVHPDTGEVRPVLQSPAPEGGARYDQARDRLIFHRFEGDTPILTGFDETLFADPEGGVPLQWSPDGLHVAYTLIGDGTQTIFLARPDLSEPRALEDGPVRDSYPIYSPDGQRLAFVRRLENGSDVHIADLQTGVIERVTYREAYVGHPGWSPDGTRLVFDTLQDGEIDIAVLDLETGAVDIVASRPGYDLNPTWSPDGELIAWAGGSDDGYDIYVVALGTGEITKLTEHPANDAGPIFATVSALRIDP